ncbi:MAG: Fe-S cluster assembly protein SufD [Candidatus Aenigmarchaeota archaeon]|nr:Fe-S cluster assembly protein SufD [Candidatus Aenigmarchaeota archaeon]
MIVESFLQSVKDRNEPGWMNSKRLNAFVKFSQTGMPNPKEEEWKYTDVSKIELNNPKFGIVDIAIKSSSDKVIALPMKEAIKKFSDIIQKHFLISDSDKFVSFVHSFWDNGIFVYVPQDVDGGTIYSSIGNSTTPTYSLVILEKGSKLNLVEENTSNEDQHFSSNVTEISVKESAELNYFPYQNPSNDLCNLHYKRAILERDGKINWFVGMFGSKLSRWKIETLLNGENAECQKRGIIIGNHDQHHDMITKTFHMVQHTKGNTEVKGVLTDNSFSVYRGLVRIEKNAQQSDAYMGSHNILLGEKAKANSIPTLQIEANDVKATHGSSTGHVDEEKLFYLMTRGLDRNEAENVIVEGFVGSILNKITLEDVREKFKSIIIEKLRK